MKGKLRIFIILIVAIVIGLFIYAGAAGYNTGMRQGADDKASGQYYRADVDLYSPDSDVDERYSNNFFEYLLLKVAGFSHTYTYAYQAGYEKGYPYSEAKIQAPPKMTGGTDITVEQ